MLYLFYNYLLVCSIMENRRRTFGAESIESAEMKTEPAAPPAAPVNDNLNIATLLILYTLQGIPMGLSSSLPLIFKEKGASFESLSLFSLVSIPFSLKIIWAPLVDSLYFPSIGRRKTWLIPVQLLTGMVMIVGSHHLDAWIEDTNGIDIYALSIFFGGLYFLMATQDIAVDGWALTMLSRENVGYASICNSIGQSLGIFIANQSYIALSDPMWCRKFLGFQNNEVLVSLASFVHFWGWVFIVITLGVIVFKSERKTDISEEPDGLLDTCRHVLSVVRIRSVVTLIGVLLTWKMAFGATDSVFTFKLQEYGVGKSDLATISSFLMLLGFVLPVFISPIVTLRPLEVVLSGYTLKLFTSVLRWIIVQMARERQADAQSLDESFFVPLIVTLFLHDVASIFMFNGAMAFFNKVSDPSIGGTYMTLLNTVTNLGNMWPASLALWLLPKFTVSVCIPNHPVSQIEFVDLQCSDKQSITACVAQGGNCA